MADFLQPTNGRHGIPPVPLSRRAKKLVGRWVNDFEHNPEFQLRFHLTAMIFWMVNAAVGTAIAVLWPHLWITIGVLYVFLLSIYANWDTDYDAVSAASAFLHAKRAAEKIDGQPKA